MALMRGSAAVEDSAGSGSMAVVRLRPLHPVSHAIIKTEEKRNIKLDFTNITLTNVIRKSRHHCGPRIEKRLCAADRHLWKF